MIRTSVLAAATGVVFALALTTTSRTLPAQAPSRPAGTSRGEWPAYHGDLRNHHYSPLSQINAGNFNTLEVAWRVKTDNFGSRPEYKLEGTPLMVGGVVYTTAGTRRAVIALDAATGELRWIHGEPEGARGAAAPRQLSGRGVAYWTDGKDERIFYVTPGFRLVALDAKTGTRVAGVRQRRRHRSESGRRLRHRTADRSRQRRDRPARDARRRRRHRHRRVPPSARVTRRRRTTTRRASCRPSTSARGKRLWNFNTIPRPGEFGNETWENDSWAVNGNAGVWNQMAIDEELGLVYLPVETPSSDFYGGHRPGNNLFADTLVAVDLKTGQRKWHFQLVHHSVWNMDIATAPILEDITVDGRAIKAVSVMGKQAMVYVFDRATGQPVWPIPETPVPQGDVPGEKYSPTQPIPSKPPPYDHQGVMPETLIDFTPELHAEALKLMSMYKMGPLFTPPVVSRKEGPIASFRSSGGTNWPGGAFDPETQVLYVPSYTSLVPVGLMPPPNAEFSDIRYVVGNALTGVRYITGPGEDAGADAPKSRQAAGPGTGGEGSGGASSPTPQGLPYLKPPYGRITAIDMTKGEFIWQMAHGETPDFVRNNPALKGRDDPANRTVRRGRRAGHEDARRCRRAAGDDAAGTSARRDAARLRQGDAARRSARCSCRRSRAGRR